MKKKKKKKDELDGDLYGYPIGTIAFYGPDANLANKVAVGFIETEGAEPEMNAWFSDEKDVRFDPKIGKEVTEYLTSRGVKSVVASDGIIGCPHQEGIDYPEGRECLKVHFGSEKIAPQAKKFSSGSLGKCAMPKKIARDLLLKIWNTSQRFLCNADVFVTDPRLVPP